ncbi:hypothetical protein BDY24DRAFT_33700 [Mrakia frigida]|uniref:uncharacterized protein n=1 Tax=Mrakia frigida TaxID=29902 RepID=UPI003FCC225E
MLLGKEGGEEEEEEEEESLVRRRIDLDDPNRLQPQPLPFTLLLFDSANPLLPTTIHPLPEPAPTLPLVHQPTPSPLPLAPTPTPTPTRRLQPLVERSLLPRTSPPPTSPPSIAPQTTNQEVSSSHLPLPLPFPTTTTGRSGTGEVGAAREVSPPGYSPLDSHVYASGVPTDLPASMISAAFEAAERGENHPDSTTAAEEHRRAENESRRGGPFAWFGGQSS